MIVHDSYYYFRFIIGGGVNGGPCNPGVNPYPNNKTWLQNINLLMHPQLIKGEDLKILVGLTHQELYQLSTDFGRPFLSTT